MFLTCRFCDASTSSTLRPFRPPGPSMKPSRVASNNSFPLASGLISALNSLRQAYDCARETRQSAWEFAVEIESLESAGLSHTDSRWLIGMGYVEHAIETTRPTGKKRRFEPVGSLALPDRTCFVLTHAGAEFHDQTRAGPPTIGGKPSSNSQSAASQALLFHSFQIPAVHASNGHREETTSSSPSGGTAATVHKPKARRVPVWDANLHELRLGRQVVKRFSRHPAPIQELILAVFEEEGWPEAIDDPLPASHGLETKRRLHHTIRNLNRAQRPHLIQFSICGRGKGICWHLTPNATPKRRHYDANATPKRR